MLTHPTLSYIIVRVATWLWVKIKPPGIGPQVLVLGSVWQGNPFGVHNFDNHGHNLRLREPGLGDHVAKLELKLKDLAAPRITWADRPIGFGMGHLAVVVKKNHKMEPC